VPVRLKRKFKGKRSRDIFEMVNKACCNGSLDIDQLVEERREKYLELADTELTLLPDAIEILTALRGKVLPNGKKFKVGLSTSSSPASQQHAFARFNLDQYFDAVVTAADVKQGKPHPEAYLVAAQRLGLRPAHCLVVEDSDNGVKAARAAGCKVVAVTNTFSVKALREAGAHEVVEGLSDIAVLLYLFV
jgi:HAD superfamily hydrolase (TIGR01509 family)